MRSAYEYVNRIAALVFVATAILLSIHATGFAQTSCGTHGCYPDYDQKPLIDGDHSPLYKGYLKGFLYGTYNTGSSTPNDNGKHWEDGNSIADQIAASEGPIVVLGIGFSNWTMELCGEQDQPSDLIQSVLSNPHCNSGVFSPNWSFINQAFYSSNINPNVVFVDCAVIGAVAKYWVNDSTYLFGPPSNNIGMYHNCNNILSALGFSPDEVQVVLYKDANPGRPSDNNILTELPSSGFSGCTQLAGYDACKLMGQVAQAARYMKQQQYHNLKQMFVHSRIYGGYANPEDTQDTSHFQRLNPEPFAYEQGFAMKWLIQAQIDEMKPGGTINGVTQSLNYSTGQAPWMDWGAYMWAAGKHTACLGCPIAGLTWSQDYRYEQNAPDDCNHHSGSECDFARNSAAVGGGAAPPDNTHPSLCGRDKVAKMLMWAYCNGNNVNVMVPWLAANGASCSPPMQPTNDCTPFPQ